MNTDVALNYKAKLIQVEDKIEEIERIGFNVKPFREELEKIIIDTNSKVKISKKNTFDGFIIADYSNAISRLDKLDNALEPFEVYVKVNNYAKFLARNEISKDKISEIVREVRFLLKKLANSSVIDYEEEKKVVEPFYNGVFKAICYETYYTGRSELLVYCVQNDVDKTFIERQIKDCLKNINIENYPEIASKYYEIKRDGLNSSLLDNDFIKLLVFKDEKDKLKDTVLESANKMVKEIKSVDTQIETKLSELDKADSEKVYALDDIIDSIRDLAKSIISLAIALSIPVGVYFGSIFLLKKLFKEYSYEVKKETYSSYDNSITESTERENLFDTHLNDEAYVIKYEVPDKGSYEFYRNKSEYDLSFLKLNSLDDYINYWKSEPDVPASYTRKINIKNNQDIVTEKVDYYEIIYRTIDLESKQLVDKPDDVIPIAVFLTILAIFIDAMAFSSLAKIDFTGIEYIKHRIKKYKLNKREVLIQSKELLKLIGQNDELRKTFNIEMAKHKNLFIEAGLVLPNEVISEEEKVKLLSKGNIKK